VSGYSYSSTAACYGYLTSNQKALICTTHVKKVIAKLYCFTLRSKKSDKQSGKKFRRGQKFRLTPAKLGCEACVRIVLLLGFIA